MTQTFVDFIIFVTSCVVVFAGVAAMMRFFGLSIVKEDEMTSMIDHLHKTTLAAERVRTELVEVAAQSASTIEAAAKKAIDAHNRLEEILEDINNAR